MSRCCSNKSCACVIADLDDAQGNQSVSVTGTGTSQDPYLVRFSGLDVVDSPNIDLTIVYDDIQGYLISADFAADSTLDALGNVAAGSPSNGYVLGYNSATQQWEPQAPTSAAAAGVHTDNSLTGDGSAGSPLAVKTDPNGGLTLGTPGVALATAIVNQLVRRFADSTSRSTASPAVDTNTFSVLDSDIGRLQFWDGTDWTDLALFAKQDASLGADLLELSGPGTSDARYISYHDVLDATTDGDGAVVLISAADLTAMGAAGIKSIQYTPMVTASDGSTGVAHMMMLDFTDTTQAGGVAYAADGTGVVASQAILGSVSAVLYAS